MEKFKCLSVVERAKITTLSEEMYSVRLIAKNYVFHAVLYMTLLYVIKRRDFIMNAEGLAGKKQRVPMKGNLSSS